MSIYIKALLYPIGFFAAVLAESAVLDSAERRFGAQGAFVLEALFVLTLGYMVAVAILKNKART